GPRRRGGDVRPVLLLHLDQQGPAGSRRSLSGPLVRRLAASGKGPGHRGPLLPDPVRRSPSRRLSSAPSGGRRDEPWSDHRGAPLPRNAGAGRRPVSTLVLDGRDLARSGPGPVPARRATPSEHSGKERGAGAERPRNVSGRSEGSRDSRPVRRGSGGRQQGPFLLPPLLARRPSSSPAPRPGENQRVPGPLQSLGPPSLLRRRSSSSTRRPRRGRRPLLRPRLARPFHGLLGREPLELRDGGRTRQPAGGMRVGADPLGETAREGHSGGPPPRRKAAGHSPLAGLRFSCACRPR